MGLIGKIRAAMGMKTGKFELYSAFDIKSEITTRPVVADLSNTKIEIIVFGTKAGKLYAVKDGKIEWVFSVSEKKGKVEEMFQDEKTSDSITSMPVIEDINNDGKKEVIFGSENGKLYVLDMNGSLLWKAKAKSPIKMTPLAADINGDGKTEIVFGAMNGGVYCLNAEGKSLWTFKASSGVESSPAFAIAESEVAKECEKTAHIVFGSNDGTVYSLNKEGKINWQANAPSGITADAAIGKVFGDEEYFAAIGCNDGTMHLINMNGEIIWSYKTGGKILSAANLADINADGKLEIIFGSTDDSVYVLSAEGSKIWSYETDFWVASTPVVTDVDDDGKLEVIIGSYDKSVYVLDAEGQFILSYVPGVASITQQPGHYTDVLSVPPGRHVGKKIWQYKTDGIIVGSEFDKVRKSIVVTTSTGKIQVLKHKE